MTQKQKFQEFDIDEFVWDKTENTLTANERDLIDSTRYGRTILFAAFCIKGQKETVLYTLDLSDNDKKSYIFSTTSPNKPKVIILKR